MDDYSGGWLANGITIDGFLDFANDYTAGTFVFILALFFIVGMIVKMERPLPAVMVTIVATLFISGSIPVSIQHILIIVVCVILAKVGYDAIWNRGD